MLKLQPSTPFIFGMTTLLACTASPTTAATFELEEATVADVNRAFEAGALTSEQLVQLYINRIQTYDKTGEQPLNSIIEINPDAVAAARALDQERQQSGPRGPLHGMPVIVKDNYDTFNQPTTAGSLSLAGSIPPNDSYQVRQLREAGAIVLAKSNMAEFAWSPNVTESSILGTTRNPYNLDRVPAGSSGGTAAAVAANFGTLGLGTDTGNSIRGPSSHTALVGLRSTIGLTSRDGIVPLFLNRDIGGPMVKSVEDAALVLNAIAGYDPADPVTAAVQGVDLPDYTTFLDESGLLDARLGVVQQLFRTDTADAEVVALMEQAISELTSQGAIVEPVTIPNLDSLVGRVWSGANTFAFDINNYLESLGPDAPVQSLEEIIASGQYADYIESRMLNAAAIGDVPPESREDFLASEAAREEMRQVVLSIMDAGEYDALIYPTWSNPPRLIGDLDSPTGNNSFQLSPPTGFPAITVPMGYTVNDTLPAGLQLLGRPFDESTLLELAYDYEQETQSRRPPALFPPLPGEVIEYESVPEPSTLPALSVLALGAIFVKRGQRHSQQAVEPFIKE
ncbi:MAG: amidase [Cyanophyceae cyanobacterium]